MRQTEALGTVIFCCFSVCFFFLKGESETLLNTSENNLTMDTANGLPQNAVLISTSFVTKKFCKF